MADIGQAASSSSPGLAQLAACHLSNSERDLRQVVDKKFGLTLPVKMTRLEKAAGVVYAGEIHCLALKDWAQMIIDYNLAHMLVGLRQSDPKRQRGILVEFWRRYRACKPEHSMWDLVDSGELDLETCYPMMLHGDEGRGRKKSGFLVVTYSSYMGLGTNEANTKRERRHYLSMKLNYTGSPFCHRYLTAVLPKMFKDEQALESILSFVADDSAFMLRTGVTNTRGDVLKMCVLQNTGDWQWLAKSGHLMRSYANVEKRPRTEKSLPKGICHLCLAGQRGIPWENFRCDAVPIWWPTRFSQSPFEGMVSLLRIPHVMAAPESFFCYDLFHIYHLGVGKTWTASCLALMSDRLSASSIDERFEEMTLTFLQYCAEHRKVGYLTTITKSTLGWPDRGQFPNGQWSKGSVSVLMGSFFEHWASKQDLRNDEMLSLCRSVNQLIDRCMRMLYERDLWLTREDAAFISDLALQFLDGYRRLAKMAFDNRRNLFSLMPKAHAFEEIFYEMKALLLQKPDLRYVMSPLAHAVQISEDYVGRCSRVSRRTGPAQVVLRTLQRNLESGYSHYHDMGYLRD